MDEVNILKAGEGGLVVDFGDRIDPAVNARVHRLARAIAQALPDLAREIVPTYRSLMVLFNPLQTSRQSLEARIRQLLQGLGVTAGQAEQARVVEIPVCYGGAYGPDLAHVAEHNGLGMEEVIGIHTAKPYLVYMLGFTPGFPYLGGMSERIATPRLAQPRVAIPAGSVGIAGSQTGIYPIESPGGWQLIGRTPLRVFNPQAANPFLFAAGDHLRFVAIDECSFQSIQRDVDQGLYTPRTSR
ncbi:MAG TPA: 5-oxoprolinase subunit PxpB [Rubrivivax sp.]|nr:5-oxoprolinase subunit PxpB [Rubrivivax sp.]